MNLYEKKIFDAVELKGLLSKEESNNIRAKLKGTDGSLEILLSENPKIFSKDILDIKVGLGDLPSFSQKEMPVISPDLLKEIPEEAALQYKIVPLSRIKNTLKVGLLNPEDYRARDAIRFISMGSSINTELYVITYDVFKKIIGEYRTFRKQIKEALTALEEELKEDKRGKKKKKNHHIPGFGDGD